MGVWKKLAQKDGKLLVCGKKLAIEPCYREIPGESTTFYRRAIDGLPTPKYKEVKENGGTFFSYKNGVSCWVSATKFYVFLSAELKTDKNSTEWYTRRGYSHSFIAITYIVTINEVVEWDTNDAEWIDDLTGQIVHYGWLGSPSAYAKTLGLQNSEYKHESEISSNVQFVQQDDGTLEQIEHPADYYWATLAAPPIETKTEAIKKYEPIYDD